MRKTYTLESSDSKNSIYLAGPTYRDCTNPSWRNEACDLLEKENFDGNVFIPEFKDGIKPNDWTYSRQVDWETKHLNEATIILFWIPRDLEILPAFTTNIEFGEWLHSKKIVIGAPESAPKNEYLKARCSRLVIPWWTSLPETVHEAVSRIKEIKEMSKGKTFFTADTHFDETRTLELSCRPFKNIKEMNWEIIGRWNQTISNHDIVYHLGDFGNPQFIKHLNGKYIWIIKGNYDKPEILEELLKDERIGITSKTSSSIILNNISFNLIHAPEEGTDLNKFYLFGHIHKLQMVKRNGLNVGVDCHNFTPINSETILFYYNAIKNHYDKNVFM